MMEKWAPVNGYNGLYSVSDSGKVKSLSKLIKHPKGGFRRIKERMMKVCAASGYQMVSLYDTEGIRKVVTVHRLVANAFIKHDASLDYVNHIDGNKLNNTASNLEWCSQRENITHSNNSRSRSSRFPGVSWNKHNQSWRTQIKVNGESVLIGYFKTEQDAGSAYKTKSLALGLTNRYL